MKNGSSVILIVVIFLVKAVRRLIAGLRLFLGVGTGFIGRLKQLASILVKCPLPFEVTASHATDLVRIVLILVLFV